MVAGDRIQHGGPGVEDMLYDKCHVYYTGNEPVPPRDKAAIV